MREWAKEIEKNKKLGKEGKSEEEEEESRMKDIEHARKRKRSKNYREIYKARASRCLNVIWEYLRVIKCRS